MYTVLALPILRDLDEEKETYQECKQRFCWDCNRIRFIIFKKGKRNSEYLIVESVRNKISK